MYRSFLTTLLFAFAIMAANPALSGGSPAPKVSAADCRSAWGSTSASSSCNLLDHWVNNNQCGYHASCKYMRHAQIEDRKRTRITVSKGSEVSNCSGTLTAGSC